MHVDTRTLEDGALIEGDLCIVGAGAAGISMALEWAGTGSKVILLEGGGFSVEGAVQDLYRGENIGQRYFPLEAARLHFFGGTTGHWAGFCSVFDPVDFRERDWVPGSGWPFDRSILDPYYARAHPILELGPYEYDAGYWEAQDPEVRRLPLDPSAVWTKMWQFSPPTRFGTRYREDVVQAPNIWLYTHANVCDIEANEAVTHVQGVHVRGLDGKTVTVRARHYVLAAGAIQNARLLLASNRQAPRGLGNDHDLVGRYFMEHPEVDTGYLMMPAAAKTKMYLWEFFVTKARGELALTAAEQERQQVLNASVSLIPGEPGEDIEAWINTFPSTAEGTLQLWEGFEKAFEAGEMPKFDPSTIQSFRLFTRLEQAPNPASRITLSPDKDALGVPRVKLDWQLTPLDKQSIRRTYEVLGREMGRAGLGRVQLMEWVLTDDPMWPDILGGGWHHMGTTRMNPDPKQGVVDVNGRVHGLDNLFVAGSAVFPTAGCANPTLTLVAMSLRLADHLKTLLS